MCLIVAPNGHKYTTAAQEMRVRKMQKDFHDTLLRKLDEAFKRRPPGGQLQLEMGPLTQFIEQAYFLGREDG